MTSSHATLTKFTAAAPAGNSDAQAALDQLNELAANLEDPKTTGSKEGQAEARRRFGSASGTPA